MDVRVSDLLADDRPRSAGREGSFEEAMPVHRLALHGDEEVPGLDLAGIKADAGGVEVALHDSSNGVRNLPGGPQAHSPSPSAEGLGVGEV
jgi:hypothetical protein